MNESKLDLSGPSSFVKPNVLVLGELANAQIIAEQLKAHDLEPVIFANRKTEPFPQLSSFDRFNKLKKLFTDFAESTGGNGMVHPGTDLWAEKPELANIVHSCGLTWIGPSAKTLSVFEHRLQFLLQAERLGIPNLIVNPEPMHTRREIEAFAARTEDVFPIVLKTAKGGGHLGLLVIHDASTLTNEYPLWIEQLRYHQGEIVLFTEKYLESARLVSVPFARFRDGTIQIFPAVDASLQSKYRKLIEFCPASKIEHSTQILLRKWTRNLATEFQYHGVGAFEFLVDGPQAFLIGGLPRLNTSFHLWEKIAGTNAVSWQLATLTQSTYAPAYFKKLSSVRSSGVSFRIYAENSLSYLPQPGKIFQIQEKREWPHADCEAALHLSYKPGDTVKSTDTGVLGHLYIFGQGQKQSLRKAPNLFRDVWITGSIQTNEHYLIELAKHPWVQEGVFHTGFIDEEFIPSLTPPSELLEQSLSPLGRGSPFQWSTGEQWFKGSGAEVLQRAWIEGPNFWKENGRTGFSGVVGGVPVCAYPLTDRWNVRLGSWFLQVKFPEKMGRGIYSRTGGRIHAILFKKGAIVPAHEPILLVEAFGTLVPYSLPRPSVITLWRAKLDDQISLGQKLADFEWEEGPHQIQTFRDFQKRP